MFGLCLFFEGSPRAQFNGFCPRRPKEQGQVGDSVLSSPVVNTEAAESFVRKGMKLIMEDVCEWVFPEQLQQLLDLDLRDTGESEEALLRRCSDVIKYSVKTGHPRFFNQLYAGMEPYSTVGSFITEAIKTSLYTYEVAPVFTLVEQAVLKKMIEVIGWEDGDGTFNPGGSMSNMYALNLARYRHSPDIKENGLFGVKRQVIFTSQDVCSIKYNEQILIILWTRMNLNVYLLASSRLITPSQKKQRFWALEPKIFALSQLMRGKTGTY
uniref:Glutamate decarboxylase n=1 Tax=Neogobius melanostomus TaxID=47308 RepID=A0A8C6ST57_9GOBI